jgi:hypothetical protein
VVYARLSGAITMINPEDFTFSLSFGGGEIRLAGLRLHYRHKCLFSLDLSLEEFALAISSLQYRPAVRVDFNLQILKDFLAEMEEKLPIIEVSLNNASSQKETKYLINYSSHNGITVKNLYVYSLSEAEKILAKIPAGVTVVRRGHL